VSAETTSSLAGILLDEPGRYDIPEADYHRDPLRHLGGSLSASMAKMLLPPSCPALARWEADHPTYKDAWDLGSVTHSLTLGAGCPILEVDAEDWTKAGAGGRAAKEEARARGAVALLSKDLARARAMRDAVHADPTAHALLTLPGAPEQALVWQEDGTWCRGLLDRWPDPDGNGMPVIVDLKTCDDVSDEGLAKSFWSFGYYLPEHWYRRGYAAVHGMEADFWFVAVMKDPPHLVRSVQIDEAMRREGAARAAEALDIWRACQASGEWPAYPPTALIGPPRWARTREDYDS
jgi:hypothetical protein